jgi:hypothetical protein
VNVNQLISCCTSLLALLIIDVLISGELISCIKEDISRAKGYIYLLQQFLDDQQNPIHDDEADSSAGAGAGAGASRDPGSASAYPGSPCSLQPWAALGGYCSPHPGSRLVQYGMGRLRGGVLNPSVIYDNFLQDGAPQVPAPAVLKYLADSGRFGAPCGLGCWGWLACWLDALTGDDGDDETLCCVSMHVCRRQQGVQRPPAARRLPRDHDCCCCCPCRRR